MGLGAVHNSLDSSVLQRWQASRATLQALMPTSRTTLYSPFHAAVFVAGVDSTIACAASRTHTELESARFVNQRLLNKICHSYSHSHGICKSVILISDV